MNCVVDRITFFQASSGRHDQDADGTPGGAEFIVHFVANPSAISCDWRRAGRKRQPHQPSLARRNAGRGMQSSLRVGQRDDHHAGMDVNAYVQTPADTHRGEPYDGERQSGRLGERIACVSRQLGWTTRSAGHAYYNAKFKS